MAPILGLENIQAETTDLPDGRAHVKTFAMKTDNAIFLMNKLFS
jgi:hypothetical protein